VTQVETLLTQAQSLSAQLEQLRAVNSHALAMLLGISGEARVHGSLEDDRSPVRVARAGLPSDLLRNRSDILAAEHRLQAAHANIAAARAAFFPQITLTGSLGTASADLDGLFEPGSRTWTFLPNITLPIFTGGRLRSNLKLAEVRRNIAVSTYESTVQAAFRDVADALSEHRWLSEQTEIQRHALSVATERSRLAQLRYDSGAAAYLEVLDAQRDLLATQQTFVATQRELQSSRVGLFASLGGGNLGNAD
jgi:multidrug efflux system outer membrane protein